MADSPETPAELPPRRQRNPRDILNLLCVLAWAAAVLALYVHLPLFWQRTTGYGNLGANPKLFVFLMAFILFLVVLGSVWVKIGKRSPRPGKSRLGTVCIVLAASVAVGMLAFHGAYAAYANYLHDRSCLAKLRFKDVASATYPGDRCTLVTRIKTPSVNGIAYIDKGPAVLLIAGETAWPADVQVPVRILEYGGGSTPQPGFGVENRRWIGMGGVKAPIEHLDVELAIPEDDVEIPFRVTGCIEIKATFPVLASQTTYKVVHDGQMQTQEVSFWVVPKRMKSEMLRELHMYKRTSMLIPTLLLACSSLIPIFFVRVYPTVA